VPTGTDLLGDFKSMLEGLVTRTLRQYSKHGWKICTIETSQTLSLLDTVNEVIFLAVIGVERLKGFQVQGGFALLTP